MTDKDFPLNGYKRPASWEEAVFAMRNEMATHPVILAAATLFNIEINIVDWIGVSGVLSKKTILLNLS